MTHLAPLSITGRFAWIMRELQAAVAARIRFPPVTGAIILHIHERLRRIAAEFEALADKIRAGTYVARRQTGGWIRRRRAAPRSFSSPIRMHYELGLPPWQPGWLHRVAPNNAGVWAAALRELFSEPEMAAVLVAAPRMRRILRPLCFMLGLEASLLTPPPPPVAVVDAPTAPIQAAVPRDTVATPSSAPPKDLPLGAAGHAPETAGAIFSAA